jgi:carbamoyltransferase
MNILGISAYYHDSAACLIQDGRIIAAAQEERFSRKKHDHDFPLRAAAYCLRAGQVSPDGVDVVVFYDKPITKFARLLKTYLHVAPAGARSFLKATPLWLKQKLWIPYETELALERLGFRRSRATYFARHHESHAASAFYPSPFQSAAIVTMDGVGEWSTTSIGLGKDNRIELLEEMRFPHSLGLLYSAFTAFCGFKVNSGEYKLMGLAPYGEPKFVSQIYDHLLDLREDGSFRMNLGYFDYLGGSRMTNDAFARLFGGGPREPEGPITKRELDLARSIQTVTEEVVVRVCRHALSLTGEKSLCLAGGVALNCVANTHIRTAGIAERLWIQPAAGDAGGALGCALLAWHHIHGHSRTAVPTDQMQGCYLGPSFSDEEIRKYLDENSYPYEVLADDHQRAKRIAQLIADGKVVGLLMGRMEFGPRALGHRSILGDARSPQMQSIMNLKVKYRESFRPFAPAVLRDDAASYFDLDVESPYMLLTAQVRDEIRREASAQPTDLTEWVTQVRSTIPAVTHVDYSVRVQTVSRERNPELFEILQAFKELTGVPVVINTSFNVRGEPPVATPEDAYRCFTRTQMDYLVLEHSILDRMKQQSVSG